MKDNFIKINGLVVNQWAKNESDLSIKVFTKEFGNIFLDIFGIKKSNKREKSAIDVMTLSEFVVYKNKDKFNVAKFETKDSFLEVKENKQNIFFGLAIIGILNKIENDDSVELFDKAIKILEVLKISTNLYKNYCMITYFLFLIIKINGIVYNYVENGNIFSIEKSKFIDNILNNDLDYHCSNQIKKILVGVPQNKIQDLLQEKISYEEYLTVIKIYEKYLNYHINMGLNIGKFLFLGE